MEGHTTNEGVIRERNRGHKRECPVNYGKKEWPVKRKNKIA